MSKEGSVQTTMTGRDQHEPRLNRWVLRISKVDHSIIDRAEFTENLCADIAKGSNGPSTRQVHYALLQGTHVYRKCSSYALEAQGAFPRPLRCN
jgi:hypothetical protein